MKTNYFPPKSSAFQLSLLLLLALLPGCKKDLGNYDYRTTARRILISDRAALYDFLRSTDSYYIGLQLGLNSDCTRGICFVPIANPEVKMDCVLIHMNQHKLTAVEEAFVEELKRLMHP